MEFLIIFVALIGGMAAGGAIVHYFHKHIDREFMKQFAKALPPHLLVEVSKALDTATRKR